MRVVKSLILCAAIVALLPSPASAQDKKIHFNLGAGPVFAGGDLGDIFSTGFGPTLGVTFDINPRIAFQFEYSYKWFSIEDYEDSLAGRYSANHDMHMLNYNVVANLNAPESKARFFVVGGLGSYHRSVEITQYVGSGIICDPYFYICGTYPINEVIGSRGGWDFGFNIGGGVGFKIAETAEFYVDFKYHYVAGPEVSATNPLTGQSTSRSATGYYYPITFGFRF